jgi:hypothetical protein
MKNGWGVEPHAVFAQQSSNSTLPITNKENRDSSINKKL